VLVRIRVLAAGHNCEFRFDYPGMDPAQAYTATADDLVGFVTRRLPHTTVLVHDCDTDNDGWPPALDALHRVMLPCTKETWHLKLAVRGLARLKLEPASV
jgi:hypothetical protein